MKRFQVIRTHISPYQRQEFLSDERAMVEEFPLLNYETLTTFKDLKTILVTNTHTKLAEIPEDVLKQTVLIIHPNSGYDHFTTEHALWKNIPLVVGHTIRAQAVAEYSIGALFEGLQELPQHLTWDKNRNWDRKLLKDTPVWVFGYGHIGKIIADTLSVLGMKITVIDPFIKYCPHKLLSDWRQGNLGEARAIITATGLNQYSHRMFNKDFFDSLSDEVLFINGARGKLVDEKSLREYLLVHPKSFAFLDVFEKEPFGEEWHGFPQVWKTSHIAGVENDLDDKILDFERAVLADFQNLEENEFLEKYEKELLQNKWIKGVLV